MRTWVLIAGLLGAGAAQANEYDGADWGWGIAAGSGGAVVVAGGLGALAVALTEDSSGFEDLGALLLALPIGTMVGGTAGAWMYGDLSGHRTRWWGPALGGLCGGLAGVGSMIGGLATESDVGGILGLVGLVVLPGVGATTGYALALEGESVSVRPPQLMVLPDGAGGMRAQAVLVDLRF